jgi:Fe-S-cluster containining protein
MNATNLFWDEMVAPYPEHLVEQGQHLTFGWTLRHIKDQCIFLERNCCTVYHLRPWICKTYPFMIDHGQVIVSACQGLNSKSDPFTMSKLIQDLTSRTCAEEKEEAEIAYWYHIFTQSPPDTKTSLIVIDSEGIKPQP